MTSRDRICNPPSGWEFPRYLLINSRTGLVSTPSSQFGKRSFDPDRPALGEIIAYFKYLTTKEINSLTHSPGKRIWQRNYYEHVIRDEQDLAEKRKYILNNSLKWELDEFYVETHGKQGKET